MNRLFSALAVALLLCVHASPAQDTVRVMTYNVLKYGDAGRDQYFRTVVQAAKPDVVVIQEVENATVVSGFVSNVLNAGGGSGYGAGTFIDGPDTDNALFYKLAKFNFVGNRAIGTALRNISEFTIQHSSGLNLIIYSVHLKAGQSDSSARSAEVDILRSTTNTLPFGTNFLVLGDFNVYGAYESAYQKLVAVYPQTEGHVVDPLSMTGSWRWVGYAAYHTQSTRVRSFGGGATGGLDDRFDMILPSKAVSEPGGVSMINASYRAFGNDANHYNDSINRLPNSAVADSIAHALHLASDHLPVIVDLVFDPPTRVGEEGTIPQSYRLVPVFPNPFNPSTTIAYEIPVKSHVTLSVYSVLGARVRTLFEGDAAAGSHTMVWNGTDAAGIGLPSGIYFLRMVARSTKEEVSQIQKMVMMK